MNRIPLPFCALVVTMAGLAAPAGLAQAPPATADPLAANAALFYWRAFAALPDLDKKQEKALDDALELKPVDDRLAEVVRMSEPALRELHRAARQPRCVWATPVEDGIGTLLPNAGKARTLARLGVARARWYLHHGKPADGVDDLVATMILARNVGTDRILITLLVDYAIEGMVEKEAAADLGRMGPAELKQLAEKLDRLPPATTMREAVLGERDMFLEAIIRDLSKPGAKDKVLKELFVSEGDPNVNATQQLKAFQEFSAEQLVEGAVALRPLYEKLAAMTGRPLPEVNKVQGQFLADLNLKGATRAMAHLLLPAILPATQREVTAKVRLALLKAAIAVEQHGPDALAGPACQDPFAKAAFEYEKTSGGFRLRSVTADFKTGQPIALEVGSGSGK